MASVWALKTLKDCCRVKPLLPITLHGTLGIEDPEDLLLPMMLPFTLHSAYRTILEDSPGLLEHGKAMIPSMARMAGYSMRGRCGTEG